jgi:hypothetical protein
MFVILTSRPGQYRTEAGDGMRLCETYEYRFHGQTKARFVIAELPCEMKVRVIDEAPPERINLVPSKFLAHFPTMEAARAQLRSLTRFGGLDTALHLLP